MIGFAKTVSPGSLCSSSYAIAVISVTQKGDHTHVWHPTFCSCCQWTPLYHLAVVTSGTLLVGPTGL